MTIKEIINNEFHSLTGQDLSSYELQVFYDFVDYYATPDWTLKDLRGAIGDFISECYDQHDNESPEYTLVEFWRFPMAKKEFLPDKTIITYRGNKSIEYIK